MLSPSAHIDTFARDNLPPVDQWPEFNLDLFFFNLYEYECIGLLINS